LCEMSPESIYIGPLLTGVNAARQKHAQSLLQRRRGEAVAATI